MEYQDLAAFVIVLLAAAWLTRRIYRVLTSASGHSQIGACDHCPKNQDSAQPAQIVEIERKQVDESP